MTPSLGKVEEVSRKTHRIEQMSLKVSIIVTAGIMIVEIIGGILSNSLALLSDAWHMFTDTSALVLCFLAGKLTEKPPDANRTFGYHRVEILSAFLNGITLVAVAFYIFYEAIGRLFHPVEVNALNMLVITIIGLVANLFSMTIMSKSTMALNVKSAFLHVVSDALSSVGVLMAATIIFYTKWYAIDPIVSIAVGLVIVYGTLRMLREVLQILLEGTPMKIRTGDVVSTIKAIPGVCDVHDVHIWSITSYMHMMSAHIIVQSDYMNSVGEVLNVIKLKVGAEHHITHTTFQLEPEAYDEIGEVHQ
jgi:cobalt-zinc-cadmium efflux system protein